MNTPNVLILADKEDISYLDTERQSQQWNVFWKVIDYDRLHEEIDEIRQLIIKHNIDFILYSRNDQVENRTSIGWVTRALKTGYSSFSGIDSSDRVKQMVACFDDFMECGRKLDFSPGRKHKATRDSNSKRTFSIFFDTEQIGGIRYGLPRILNLLYKYDVRATFFVTNLVRKVYPNFPKIIEGHEVGLHGMWHEYLSGLEKEEQKSLIGKMIADFGSEIDGANFVGRMDESSVSAFTANKIRYFVYPLINYYWLLAYPKLPTTPSLVRLPEGDIWALPISVETYGSLWFSIKNMVDSAISQSARCGFQHISIMCHPFRDGNLQHIKTTEKLLRHLIKKGLTPVTLSELMDKLSGTSQNYPQISKLAELPKQSGTKPPFPRTRQDCMGIIPEILTLIYALLRRGHKNY